MNARLEDQKVLGWLLGSGHVTAAQAQRLERELDRGQRLEDALRDMPILDALTWERARRSMGVTDSTASRADLPKPTAEPPLKSSAAVPLAGVGRDKDGVSLLDLGEGTDVPYARPDGEHTANKKAERKNDLARKNAPADERSAEQLTAERLDLSVRAKPSPSFEGLPVVDLAADEGIPLVAQLYANLTRAVTSSTSSVQLAYTPNRAGWAQYDYEGVRTLVDPMDGVTAERMAARMKVMMRLSPWVTNDAQARCVLVRKKIGFEAVLILEESNGVRRVTLDFVAERPVA